MITATSMPIAAFKLMGLGPMELFIHGGPIMWPILITSFVCFTVAIERAIFIIREMISRQPEVVEKMLERVEQGDPEGAIALGKKSSDFVARILIYALTHREQSLSTAFVRASSQELKRYQAGGAVLDTTVTAAPYLGLLGTVTGMMRVFGELGGSTDIASASNSLMGGIGEALIATMCGLAIAIFGLIPFNILNAQTEQAKHDIGDASNALTLLTNKGKEAHV
ncbi:flagellar motor protein MotA [Termitidicoccus mucosus]|uniref:Flagellar motor protein MotA n=2 Tax=Termitidicoccus mucosus TaxID=1184151 RepID=A0A178IDU2_9BACT|nr:flagellar motor protein MotA [Opitutaceae bacterium TSB47]